MKDKLAYDPNTGIFTWRTAHGQRCKIGAPAGTLHPDGYVVIETGGKGYRAHRLAWYFMTGEWPSGQIDHIDGVRHNNRWANLRDVSAQLNTQNQRGATKRNKCGFLGVYPHVTAGKWRAQITANGKKTHIGLFDSPELAHAAYVSVKRQLHAGNTL